jgi:hypothetical protein
MMLVEACGDEGGCREPVQHLGELHQGCDSDCPSSCFVLKSLTLGESLVSLLGVLLGSEFSDEPGADVLADHTAVHLAAASVVAAAAAPRLPAHGVVLPPDRCPAWNALLWL